MSVSMLVGVAGFGVVFMGLACIGGPLFAILGHEKNKKNFKGGIKNSLSKQFIVPNPAGAMKATNLGKVLMVIGFVIVLIGTYGISN